jgi:hypothetical protein
MAMLLAACGDHAARPPAEAGTIVVRVCSESTDNKAGQIECSRPGLAEQVPNQRAAVAEVKRYFRRHPPSTDLRSVACHRTTDARMCTIKLSPGCETLAVKGSNKNPWIVPGDGPCPRAK